MVDLGKNRKNTTMCDLMFVAAFFFGYRVVTTSSPGMTAQNTPDSQITTIKKAVRLECFNHVMRTGWLETAGSRHQRGNHDLIKPYD